MMVALGIVAAVLAVSAVAACLFALGVFGYFACDELRRRWR